MMKTALRPGFRIIARVFWTFLFLLLCDLFLSTNLLMITAMALFGWILFLQRVIGEWRWSPAAWLTFAACLSALTFGGHQFLAWLRRAQTPPLSPWPWRWTIALLLLVVTTFASGIAVVGIIHQTSWIAKGGIFKRQSWGGDERILLYNLQDAFRRESPPTANEVRARLRHRKPEARIAVIEDQDGVWAVLVSLEPDPKRPGTVGIGTRVREPKADLNVDMRLRVTFEDTVRLYTSLAALQEPAPAVEPPAVEPVPVPPIHEPSATP